MACWRPPAFFDKQFGPDRASQFNRAFWRVETGGPGRMEYARGRDREERAVRKFSYITLLLGMAGSLTAQTLSFGEITLVTPATTPPSYVVNIVLTTANTANAGLVAG